MSTNNTTSVSSSSMKHDADQAGGEKEIVYSSDGGDPIKILFPPKVQFDYTGDDNTSKTNTTNTNDDAIVVHDTISSEQAFEVFAGKLFYPNSKNKVSYNNTIKEETPLQKLSRIQAELNELKSYVDTDCSIVIDNTASGSASSTGSSSSSAINESFASQIQSLQNVWGMLSDATAKQQETLASTIDAAVDGLSSSTSKTSTLIIAKDPSVSTQVQGQITSKSSSTTSVLEERIKRLELVVGAAGAAPVSTIAATTTAALTSSSIAERIQKLEKLNINYDEKQSDMIQKRAKVIRQDLEAAAKARSKLMSLGGSGGGTSSGAGSSGTGSGNNNSNNNNNNNNIADDAKVISALYDQLQSLSGMTEHLPVLAERVQSLAINHRNVSTWEERLHTSEQIITSVQQQLSSLDTNITTLHTSIQNNTNQMKTNIDLLENRIMKL